MKATGLEDYNVDLNNMGHIAINGRKIFNLKFPAPTGRGFNLVLFDHARCIGYRYITYDTHFDTAASIRLANDLNGLPHGTIILGISSDSADLSLGPAKWALKSLGVDVDTLAFRDKVLFIVEKNTKSLLIVKRSRRFEPHIEIDYEF